MSSSGRQPRRRATRNQSNRTSTGVSHNTARRHPSHPYAMDSDREGVWSGDDSDDERFHMLYNAGINPFGLLEDNDHEISATRSQPRQQRTVPLAPPPPTLCRFFVLGTCRYGSRCTYSHSIPATEADGTATSANMARIASTLVDCPYFLRGNCKYGTRCRLRHGTRASNSHDSNHQDDVANHETEHTCGICYEDIVQAGKHFGLLSCDHCFCLDCLRTWRQSKSAEVELTRACPVCREASNFIVPSLTFCTGEAKATVVDTYKRHLAVRECKYFDGVLGSCPFGPNCFYAHRDATGQDVKHLDIVRPKLKARRLPEFIDPTSMLQGSNAMETYRSFMHFLEALGWEDFSDTHLGTES